jgi:hypothetical protein
VYKRQTAAVASLLNFIAMPAAFNYLGFNVKGII